MALKKEPIQYRWIIMIVLLFIVVGLLVLYAKAWNAMHKNRIAYQHMAVLVMAIEAHIIDLGSSVRPMYYYYTSRQHENSSIVKQFQADIYEVNRHWIKKPDYLMYENFNVWFMEALPRINRPPSVSIDVRDVYNSSKPYRLYYLEKLPTDDFILVSTGPNGVEDITLETIYNYIWKSESFIDRVYDPTNGIISSGDIVFSLYDSDASTFDIDYPEFRKTYWDKHWKAYEQRFYDDFTVNR